MKPFLETLAFGIFVLGLLRLLVIGLKRQTEQPCELCGLYLRMKGRKCCGVCRAALQEFANHHHENIAKAVQLPDGSASNP